MCPNCYSRYTMVSDVPYMEENDNVIHGWYDKEKKKQLCIQTYQKDKLKNRLTLLKIEEWYENGQKKFEIFWNHRKGRNLKYGESIVEMYVPKSNDPDVVNYGTDTMYPNRVLSWDEKGKWRWFLPNIKWKDHLIITPLIYHEPKGLKTYNFNRFLWQKTILPCWKEWAKRRP